MSLNHTELFIYELPVRVLNVKEAGLENWEVKHLWDDTAWSGYGVLARRKGWEGSGRRAMDVGSNDCLTYRVFTSLPSPELLLAATGDTSYGLLDHFDGKDRLEDGRLNETSRRTQFSFMRNHPCIYHVPPSNLVLRKVSLRKRLRMQISHSLHTIAS